MSIIWLKKSNLIENVKNSVVIDFLIKIEQFSIKFDFFDHNHVRICIVAMNPIKSIDDYGSKKLIKLRYEYNLKRILAGGPLDCIISQHLRSQSSIGLSMNFFHT